jgi:hypothetical protein
VSIAYVSPVPYAILLIVSLVIITVCFLKLPSLRAFHKRRNLLIYVISALILSLIAYEACDSSLGPTVVSYNLETETNQFYGGQVNQFNISCTNLGIRETNFYLVVKSINASFIVGEQLNYVQINSTAIKILFKLNAFNVHTTNTKSVIFTIDANATGFGFYFDCPVLATSSTTEALGLWNTTTNIYSLSVINGPCI